MKTDDPQKNIANLKRLSQIPWEEMVALQKYRDELHKAYDDFRRPGADKARIISVVRSGYRLKMIRLLGRRPRGAIDDPFRKTTTPRRQFLAAIHEIDRLLAHVYTTYWQTHAPPKIASEGGMKWKRLLRFLKEWNNGVLERRRKNRMEILVLGDGFLDTGYDHYPQEKTPSNETKLRYESLAWSYHLWSEQYFHDHGCDLDSKFDFQDAHRGFDPFSEDNKLAAKEAGVVWEPKEEEGLPNPKGYFEAIDAFVRPLALPIIGDEDDYLDYLKYSITEDFEMPTLSEQIRGGLLFGLKWKISWYRSLRRLPKWKRLALKVQRAREDSQDKYTEKHGLYWERTRESEWAMVHFWLRTMGFEPTGEETNVIFQRAMYFRNPFQSLFRLFRFGI